MSSTQKDKRSFRNSKAWRSFRHQMNVKCGGRDELTGKKLLKGYQLHHLDLNADHYRDLNEDNFACLNKMSHQMVHFIYGYYCKDRGIIARLINILDRMIKINN